MFNRKMLIVAILSLVYLNPAKASLNCSTQPTCESLGYTMESDANCAEDGYVYCPFDAKYKKCVRPVIKQDAFCANFNLSSCPANAQCYKCESPNGALYLFKGCEDGYLQQEYSCVKTYQTCVEAGLWDEGSEETCAGTIEITLPDATTKVCYYDCCEYIDEQACEAATANINSECTLKDGCYLPTDCKEGFYKEANDTNCSGGLYNTLSGIDANGCGYCATEFTSCEEAGYSSEPIANGVSKPIYTSSGRLQTFCVAPSNEDACREAFFNANCVEDEDGGYKANGCKQEVTSCEEGYTLVTDLAGCKGCKKDCEFDDLSACESAEKNANTTCKEDEEGCFVADTKCKTGFISDVALCEGEYLTAGLKDTDANGCGTCYESNCDYKTGDECQSKYTNSKCEETSTGGCFVPTGCKDGFYKEANGTNCAEGIYTELGGVDEYGCGYCATKFTSCEEAGYSSEPIANGKQLSVYLSNGSKARCMAPVDKDACTDAFFNSKCVDDGNGNYKADGCLQESVSSCEEGYQKITDAAGCSACKAVCEYYDEATCTQKNANSVCEPDTKGCYIATGCKANYYKEANSANCTQGEFSTLGGVDAYGCGYCATAHSTCEEAGYFTTNESCTDLSPEPWPVYSSNGGIMGCISCGSPKCAESEKSNSRCEAAYTNSICSQADDGCYKPTECKANYYKEANEATCGNLAEYIYTTISGADAYGCGYCASTYSTCEQAGYYTDAEACSVLNNPKVLYLTDGKETICQDCKSISCQYNDKGECESENANSECTESKYHEGCYAPTKCLENYATSCDEGYTLTEVDAYGCGTCKKNCTYADEAACEKANANSDCTNVDGCYELTGCKSGYTLTDGVCVLDKVRYDSEEACERANVVYDCVSDGNGKYITGNCIAKGGDCFEDNDHGDCMMDFYAKECPAVPGGYVPDCMYYTKAECEADNIYTESCLKYTTNNCWYPDKCLDKPYVSASCKTEQIFDHDNNRRGCWACLS
ncbi:MAG: hypothetical protein IJW75_04575, partial [Alphaproteobacteria bacterium]|nr:hypothetical protein [Alphaproteobacteria bacterium]